MKKSRGVTLLECLIYIGILALLAVSSLRVVGDARMMRSNARDRSLLTLIAQTELERGRALPAEKLAAGKVVRRDQTWPEGVEATVETAPRPDGTWLLDIQVTRQSIEGKPSVRLTTIRGGTLR